MNDQHLQDLIHRYRQGRLTADERKQLEDHWQQMLHKNGLEEFSADERSKTERRMFAAIVQSIHRQEPDRFQPKRRTIAHPWMVMAASVTGLLLLFTTAWLWFDMGGKDFRWQTAYGEKKHIVLPEGSDVWLNGHSSLRYALDARGNRQVWLDGEAQFSVRHTASHQKFVVHLANQLAVEVLGTVFNVVNRPGMLDVVLKTGAVQLIDETHKKAMWRLKPNERVSLTRQRPTLAKSAIKAQPRLAWKDGAMYVENKSLGELFDWIHDTYGISVNCPARLRQETFAGTIPTDSIDSFFTIIAKLYQVNVHKDGKTYLID